MTDPKPCPNCAGPRVPLPSGYIVCRPCQADRVRAWRYGIAAALGRIERIYRTAAEEEEAARRIAIYEARFLEILDEHGIDVEACQLPHVSLFDRLPPVEGDGHEDPEARCTDCGSARRRVKNGKGGMRWECHSCVAIAKTAWRRRQATG